MEQLPLASKNVDYDMKLPLQTVLDAMKNLRYANSACNLLNVVNSRTPWC
jgi:hypothetical protein